MGYVGLALGDALFNFSKILIFDFFIIIFFGIGFGVSIIPELKNVTKYFPKEKG